MSEAEYRAAWSAYFAAINDGASRRSAWDAGLRAAFAARPVVAPDKAVLQQVEWARYNASLSRACPCCASYRTEGHAPDCALAAALRGPTVDHVNPINGDVHRQDPATGRIVATVRTETGAVRERLTDDQRWVLSALAAAPSGLSSADVAVLLGLGIGGPARDMLIALRHAGFVDQIGVGSRWAITDAGRRALAAEDRHAR